jgi:cytochrome c oxidase cbb3-type subunit III
MKKSLVLAGSMILPMVSFAAEGTAVTTNSYFSNALFNTLLAVIIILAIMVVALSSALKNIISSDLFLEKIKKNKEQKGSSATKALGLAFVFFLISTQALAQEKLAQVVPVKSDSIGGLDQFTFYTMLVTICLELLVLGILFNTFKNILGQGEAKKLSPVLAAKPKGKTILDKLNDTVEIEQEESIMLDHDYDGIKELDNNLPPWWKYGFYLTILIAVIYLINYHITKTSPLQGEEYTLSVKKAEAEIAEYMKTSANNVDESTVKLLTDPSDIATGKDLFIMNCSACHGKLGEGSVGPNLADDYWLHNGGVKDIFKTIKYGWPDKGMKAWKDDFSPMQIAQITSFIRTLKGTNPPKPKEKQGDLYTEQAPVNDSTSVTADTAKVLSALEPQQKH